jgi:hypothetical protein
VPWVFYGALGVLTAGLFAGVKTLWPIKVCVVPEPIDGPHPVAPAAVEPAPIAPGGVDPASTELPPSNPSLMGESQRGLPPVNPSLMGSAQKGSVPSHVTEAVINERSGGND